jgi:hypothetical protein
MNWLQNIAFYCGHLDIITKYAIIMMPNSLRKRLNLATMKPNPMRAMLVLAMQERYAHWQDVQ